jgi:hypothetical protein
MRSESENGESLWMARDDVECADAHRTGRAEYDQLLNRSACTPLPLR